MKHYIRKYILVSAVLAFGGTFASAQTTETETKTITSTSTINAHYYKLYHQGFWDNWAVEVMGGVRMLCAEEDGSMDFGKRLAPGLKLGLTKEITPDVSLRGAFGFGTLKGWNSGVAGLYKAHSSWGEVDPVRTYLEGEGVDCTNGYEQEIQHFTVGVDMLLNLWNVFTTDNQIGRRWNPYFFLGTEYFQIMNHKGYERTYKLGLHAGLKLDVSITKRLAVTGEIAASTHSATFDNEIGKGNRHDFYAQAMLGLKYRLGRLGYDVEAAVMPEDMDQIQDVVTYIKEKYDVPPTGPVKVLPSSLLAPSIVFDEGKITYSQELQMVNLSQMAEYMKQNPNLKIAVIGNTHSVDKALALGRAEVIRQKLIDRYDVNGDNLTVTALDVNKEYDVVGNDQSVNFGVAQ